LQWSNSDCARRARICANQQYNRLGCVRASQAPRRWLSSKPFSRVNLAVGFGRLLLSVKDLTFASSSGSAACLRLRSWSVANHWSIWYLGSFAIEVPRFGALLRRHPFRPGPAVGNDLTRSAVSGQHGVMRHFAQRRRWSNDRTFANVLPCVASVRPFLFYQRTGPRAQLKQCYRRYLSAPLHVCIWPPSDPLMSWARKGVRPFCVQVLFPAWTRRSKQRQRRSEGDAVRHGPWTDAKLSLHRSLKER